MIVHSSIYFLLIFILLAFSAFFSGAETAIFSISARRLKKMRREKLIGSSLLVKMKKNPRRILTTILLGNDLVNIAISILAAQWLSLYLGHLNETVFFILTAAITTFFIILFGEILPKNIAIRMAPVLAPMVVYPLQLFSTLTTPLRILILFVADHVMALFGGRIGAERRMIVEEEFRTLVAASKESNQIDHLEKKLVDNVFSFSTKKISEFYTPKENMITLPEEAPFDQVLSLLKEKRCSRIPIFRVQKNNIVGILLAKDLLSHQAAHGKQNFSLTTMMTEPYFVSPHTSASDLLKIFQSKKIHMAFIRDDENLMGLITLDDLLKNLLGA